MRTVIFHYHLFKNAGTSLDAAFKENFSEEKGEWVTKEFPANRRQNQEQVKQWIIDNPQAKCFSSHTAQLPPPQIDGVRVLPVLFIRHPIDRIASAYSFETKQPGNSVGAVIARNTDLKGYVEIRIAIPNDGQCQNFHTSRLSQYRQDPNKTALDNAKFALENLYFVGVVEHFNDSIAKLEQQLRNDGFNNIALKPKAHNTSRSYKSSLEEKLEEIRAKVGDETYEKLNEENLSDLTLHQELVSRF
ncbi:sulfotransferase family 2 domain-containing protein [Idiomarina sp.]|uniref:sulfotransferase family 2 domain-containing protein n=1 Tax=Idiomarina sp. TaxID=1874361 RepID=UPI0025C40E60|nr:sulfotransferase family 2 domain-containing protein [Idiomarina sp.]